MRQPSIPAPAPVLTLCLALGLALCVLDTTPAASYELPQVCREAFAMQREPSPDRARIIELYGQCLQGDLSPKNRAVALLNRGNARFRGDDLDGALADYDASIASAPLAKTHNSRAVARERKDDVEGAFADYARAMELDPGYHEPYYNRGIARKKRGDLAGAVQDYTQALERMPTHAKSLGNRAFALKDLGEMERAKADAARAKELDPGVRVPTF